MAEEKFTVSGNKCYGINPYNAANFDVKENECPLTATSNSQPKYDDLGKNSGKTGKAVCTTDTAARRGFCVWSLPLKYLTSRQCQFQLICVKFCACAKIDVEILRNSARGGAAHAL